MEGVVSITEIGGLLVFGDSYAVEIIVPKSLGDGHPVYWSDGLKLNLRIRSKAGWVETPLTEAQAEVIAKFIQDFASPIGDLYDFGEHLYMQAGALGAVNGDRRVKYEEAKAAAKTERVEIGRAHV